MGIFKKEYDNNSMFFKILGLKLKTEINLSLEDLDSLVNISVFLGEYLDQDTLFDSILFNARSILSADSGSIYLIRENENGEKELW